MAMGVVGPLEDMDIDHQHAGVTAIAPEGKHETSMQIVGRGQAAKKRAPDGSGALIIELPAG
ncbi:hypothetical protein NIM87_15860 [Devosia sp. XJ19-1]|uniref:Uncharacterized protein n=1 Tax=Devosia ureilytica TaxID=2952754 RepID=A0A9Q4FU35_9HYPH|nr:hypothetical protein [Devosia ureilytica]MCP8884986.1 hypothetical protein [Devosia ureilytica]MCP8888503.1 hypothetical protein [Devosia ureilytica]